MTHQEVLRVFEQLDATQKRLAISAIENSWEGRSGLLSDLNQQIIDGRSGSMACPHCSSAKTICRGKQKEIEKFSCKDCGKHFRSSHGTALYRIQRKDKWQGYLRLMEQGYSIKKAARELGISIQTSFDWRHKILSSLQSSLPQKLGGVVECDDFQLAESLKGQKKIDRKPRKRGSDSRRHKVRKVSVVTAVSRGKGSMVRVVAAKKISGKQALAALDKCLDSGTTLITDEAQSYNAVSKNNPGIIHKKVNSYANRTSKPKGRIHLQTVNNQHKQMRDFLTPFNGVATKYLPNYLNWFLYKQSQAHNKDKIASMLYNCLSAATALVYLAKLSANEMLIRT